MLKNQKKFLIGLSGFAILITSFLAFYTMRPFFADGAWFYSNVLFENFYFRDDRYYRFFHFFQAYPSYLILKYGKSFNGSVNLFNLLHTIILPASFFYILYLSKNLSSSIRVLITSFFTLTVLISYSFHLGSAVNACAFGWICFTLLLENRRPYVLMFFLVLMAITYEGSVVILLSLIPSLVCLNRNKQVISFKQLLCVLITTTLYCFWAIYSVRTNVGLDTISGNSFNLISYIFLSLYLLSVVLFFLFLFKKNIVAYFVISLTTLLAFYYNIYQYSFFHTGLGYELRAWSLIFTAIFVLLIAILKDKKIDFNIGSTIVLVISLCSILIFDLRITNEWNKYTKFLLGHLTTLGPGCHFYDDKIRKEANVHEDRIYLFDLSLVLQGKTRPDRVFVGPSPDQPAFCEVKDNGEMKLSPYFYNDKYLERYLQLDFSEIRN